MKHPVYMSRVRPLAGNCFRMFNFDSKHFLKVKLAAFGYNQILARGKQIRNPSELYWTAPEVLRLLYDKRLNGHLLAQNAASLRIVLFVAHGATNANDLGAVVELGKPTPAAADNGEQVHMQPDIRLQPSMDIYSFGIIIAEILMRQRAFATCDYTAAG